MTQRGRRRPAITQPMRQEVARRLGVAPGEVSAQECTYCREPIIVNWADPDRVRFLDTLGRSRPELDHVHALANGGPHTAQNLVPACLSCNRRKGAS